MRLPWTPVLLSTRFAMHYATANPTQVTPRPQPVCLAHYKLHGRWQHCRVWSSMNCVDVRVCVCVCVCVYVHAATYM